jgi:hypothetical protein
MPRNAQKVCGIGHSCLPRPDSSGRVLEHARQARPNRRLKGPEAEAVVVPMAAPAPEWWWGSSCRTCRPAGRLW